MGVKEEEHPGIEIRMGEGPLVGRNIVFFRNRAVQCG